MNPLSGMTPEQTKYIEIPKSGAKHTLGGRLGVISVQDRHSVYACIGTDVLYPYQTMCILIRETELKSEYHRSKHVVESKARALKVLSHMDLFANTKPLVEYI